MTATYDCIATTTLSTTTASITFTSIPSTYTDLVLVSNLKSTGSQWVGLCIQVNSDTAGNYSDTYMYGDGSAAGSIRDSSATFANSGALSHSNFHGSVFQFMNYANTTTYKTWLCRSGIGTEGWLKASVNLWRSTSAITSIKVYHSGGDNLASGSTAALYGIKAE